MLSFQEERVFAFSESILSVALSLATFLDRLVFPTGVSTSYSFMYDSLHTSLDSAVLSLFFTPLFAEPSLHFVKSRAVGSAQTV